MTELTTAQKLARLNELRAERNQAPLKSWKGSTKALDETITAYTVRKVSPAVAEGAYDTTTKAEASTELKGTHEKAREAIRKANTPPPAKASAKRALDRHLGIPEETGKAKRRAEKTADRIKSMTAETSTKKTTKSNYVSLADIAREIGMEPKLARAKARKSNELTKLAQGDSWAFKPADVSQVKKLLK